VLLRIEGKNKFAARVGKHRDGRAVKITRQVSPGDALERPVTEVSEAL
jgi:flagellar motor switch protein FliM